MQNEALQNAILALYKNEESFKENLILPKDIENNLQFLYVDYYKWRLREYDRLVFERIRAAMKLALSETHVPPNETNPKTQNGTVHSSASVFRSRLRDVADVRSEKGKRQRRKLN